ncbi:polysaccharide ABC transporter ATP-binding protein [Spirosoma utsteinense]|uniref:Lipopolysaccharide transport system ATP-binding protein n=1 Tax=Spirosoma utsteinense TaxID=2585773 RepID=A0ABR6W5T6_9BACT|nr:polysaccharide ABC transporter ATP-binding protein [Spirosoma utsteinense]MBC3786320.1 lipopolysaccharide transport system ATP-binding protein [Spirosoma utsteinense]MBC3791946.1 lipopolysaccharide transport system ATP-binding protein [Spirosoma utsteinense]
MSVITVENISKQYIIDHQKGKGSNTLRDVISANFRQVFNGQKKQKDESKEEFWALRDVSFSIEQGDRVGIVGHNGAGKSTMLKILSKIIEPTTGSVRIRGRVASLLEVGTGFHPELTGRENIYLNGSLLGMSRSEIRKQFDEIVAFAGVEKFLDTPVKRYSSGMYVRLGFAISAHLDPEIMIVDEVLAVGDAEFQKKSLGKMRDNSASGRTIIFVSHNLTAVQALCNKTLYFEKGQLIEQGETNQVIASYLSKVSKTRLVRQWDTPQDAPGNDLVRVRRIEMTPEYQDDLTHIDVRTPMKLRFEFWNMMDHANLNLSLHLNSLTGECIFNIGTRSQAYGKGLIAGECTIPGYFLNDGSYTISVMIVKDTVTPLYTMEEGITFDVEDYREGIAWYGKWPGYVRPQFPFEMGMLEEATVK